MIFKNPPCCPKSSPTFAPACMQFRSDQPALPATITTTTTATPKAHVSLTKWNTRKVTQQYDQLLIHVAQLYSPGARPECPHSRTALTNTVVKTKRFRPPTSLAKLTKRAGRPASLCYVLPGCRYSCSLARRANQFDIKHKRFHCCWRLLLAIDTKQAA